MVVKLDINLNLVIAKTYYTIIAGEIVAKRSNTYDKLPIKVLSNLNGS